jgi:hypothetical protein
VKKLKKQSRDDNYDPGGDVLISEEMQQRWKQSCAAIQPRPVPTFAWLKLTILLGGLLMGSLIALAVVR